ncbi:MAG: MBL fold metallo-hydrolase [Paenibacillus sp.]|nr:MBL fold metallo-hydrolase [Paenibacillus sp.]
MKPVSTNINQQSQRRKSKKTILKRILLYFVVLLALVGLTAVLVINLNPAFGGNLTKEQKQAYKKYANFVDGKFVNLEPTDINFTLADSISMIRDSINGGTELEPTGTLPVVPLDWDKIRSEEDSLTWFGHSAFLVSLDNKKILVDPMLSLRSSPVSFVGGSTRYTGSILDIIDDMPTIDAVFLTHDHYDHLDYSSILKLKNKTNHFFVPLGVSNHLIRWGVPEEDITELGWWDETEYEGLKVVFTPSQHMSGRGPFNGDTTLWGSWVMLGQNTRFYTSGDGGYGNHFKEIGQRYGPFDIALIEGGQYDERWRKIHMVPEESLQAQKDLGAKNMMLIHWAGFTLAYHGWTEPIERAIRAAEKENVNLVAPQIGETLSLQGELSFPITHWWNER